MSGFANKYFRYFIPLALLGVFFLLIAVLPNRGFSFAEPPLAQAQTCGGTRQVCTGGGSQTVNVHVPKYCTREVNCRTHDVCDARNKKGKCIRSHTVRKCDSQTYQCGTQIKTETWYASPVCREVANPPCASAPTCQDECTTNNQWQCIGTANQYRVCNRVNNCYKWTQAFTCGANTQCVAGTPGSCPTKPGKEIPGVLVSNRWFTLTAGYGSPPVGTSGNTYLPVGENTNFSLRWDANWPGATSFYKPTGCVKWGTQLNGGWQGSANVDGGQLGPFSFSGRSNIGPHTFQIACSGLPASNIVTVVYERASTQPTATCASNECSPNQCWNNGQTRSCVKDPVSGNYCWKDPILSCVPGSHCDGGQCVNDKTGQPQPPPETTTPPPGTPLPGTECRPGIDAACTPPGGCTSGTPGCPTTCTIGVDCPSGVVPPGAGDGGGPAFGSTQCYDGKDNDLDGKIDAADSGCLDPNGIWNKSGNSEFNFKIKEIIPDFFNLNWFKLNVANFFRAEALAK